MVEYSEKKTRDLLRFNEKEKPFQSIGKFELMTDLVPGKDFFVGVVRNNQGLRDQLNQVQGMIIGGDESSEAIMIAWPC